MQKRRERRKRTRFSIDKRTFATLRPVFDKFGRIVDVSEQGLAFEYVCYNRDVQKSLMELGLESELDILVASDDFYLPQIPCSVIHDEQITEGRESGPLDIVVRRCGVRFGDLTMEQQSLIDFFVQIYGTKRSRRDAKLSGAWQEHCAA